MSHKFTAIDKIKSIFDSLRWAWQRVYRGWDDRVIWSIDWHLAKMLPVWLRRLRDHKHSTHHTLNVQEWHATLDEMIAGFEAAQRILNLEGDLTQQVADHAVFDEGMKLFTEHFFSLWD